MAEEVNSKAAPASSAANRLGVPSQNRLENVGHTPGRGHHGGSHPRAAGAGGAAFATSADCWVHLPRYRATICLMGFRETGRAIRTNDREMSSHIMRSHWRLAQNDKRKSEHDGRGDHGSDLGKYGP